MSLADEFRTNVRAHNQAIDPLSDDEIREIFESVVEGARDQSKKGQTSYLMHTTFVHTAAGPKPTANAPDARLVAMFEAQGLAVEYVDRIPCECLPRLPDHPRHYGYRLSWK